MRLKIFKIAGRKVRFIHANNASKKLFRVGLRTPGITKVLKRQARSTGMTLGQVRDRKALGFALDIHFGTELGGVVAGGGFKKRAFINASVLKMQKKLSGDSGIRRTVNHELFHTLPGIGGSELGAHFAGGLLSKKGKLSFKAGVAELKRFKKIRPDEYRGEVSRIRNRAAIGAVIGVPTVAYSKRKKNKQRVMFRRIKGRIVPIRRKIKSA